MRIAILTQYYLPEMGAPQARLSELATHLRNNGHEVMVLTAFPNYPTGRLFPGYAGKVMSREILNGITVLRALIYPTIRLDLVHRLASYFSFVFSSFVVGLFRLPRLDYLVTESPPLFLGMSGWLLSWIKGARWIFNVSDLWPESAVRMGLVGPGLGLTAALKLEGFCYRRAWTVTGQSREIVEDVVRRFPGVRGYHLSNGVDTERFHPRHRQAEWRAKLAPGKTCIALYAGLHGAAQGLMQLLEAAEQLRDLPHLQIVMVGDGPEKEMLRESAARRNLTNVTFLDPVGRSEIPHLVASADIALIPLKSYLPGAVPSKIYEAMGAGVPIVLAAEGEAARIVERHRAGIVVSPSDSRGLAEGVRRLAADPLLRNQLGAGGREGAQSEFDRLGIARRFNEFLQGDDREVLRGPGPSLHS